MEEYNEYVKPIMDELNKTFKYFTKKSENSWLIQSNKKSLMEAFFVDTTYYSHIIMSGDYDGIMVRPQCTSGRLINWMSGATALSYFAEKVVSANRHHECKEYSEKKAEKNLKEIQESLLEDLETDEKNKKKQEFDDFIKYHSLEFEHEYRTLINELEHEFELCDLQEYNPSEYTDRIKWQHKCLLFWANKVLEGAFESAEGERDEQT